MYSAPLLFAALLVLIGSVCPKPSPPKDISEINSKPGRRAEIEEYLHQSRKDAKGHTFQLYKDDDLKEAKMLMKCVRKESAAADGRKDPEDDSLVDDDIVNSLEDAVREASQFPNCQHLIKLERRKRQVSTGLRKWANAVVYYMFGPDFSTRVSGRKDLVRSALAGISAVTCLTFQEVSDTSESPVGAIIVDSDNSGCWSYIGKTSTSGNQYLNLQDLNGAHCMFTGIIQHEFMHAVGLYHEQSRIDRDLWVRINTQNIQSGREHNFNKCTGCPDSIDSTPYDYGSVMHYGRYAFSSNGQETITPLVGNPSIGQRNGLSSVDAQILNLLYCPLTTAAPTTAAPTTAAPTTAAPTTAAPTTAAPTTAAPTTAAPTTAAPTTAAPTTAAPTTAAPTTAAPTTAVPTTEEPDNCDYTFVESNKRPRKPIKYTGIASVEECSDYCCDDEDCVVFSWKTNGRCDLGYEDRPKGRDFRNTEYYRMDDRT